MTPEIERLAKEAGLRWLITTSDRDACYTVSPEQLAKFAALVAEEAIQQHEHLIASYRAHNAAGLPVVEIIPASAASALSSPEDAAK